MDRYAEVTRKTGETDIVVKLDLDGSGVCDISTGVPFFDHMLNAFGRHGLFDLTVHAVGDVEVDAHHTVEDTGIVLGEAFCQALGDKAGITRFADAATLLNFAFANYSLYSIAANTVIPPVRVRFAETDSMQPVLSGADAIVVRKGTAAPQTDIALDEELCAPLEPGAQVGTVTITDSSGDTRILPLVVPDGAARISTAHLWLQLLRAL